MRREVFMCKASGCLVVIHCSNSSVTEVTVCVVLDLAGSAQVVSSAMFSWLVRGPDSGHESALVSCSSVGLLAIVPRWFSVDGRRAAARRPAPSHVLEDVQECFGAVHSVVDEV